MQRIFLFLLFFFPVATFAAPFGDAAHITNILTADDEEIPYTIIYEGISEYRVYDAQLETNIWLNVFVFTGNYIDGTTTTYLVNPEFENVEVAREIVTFYASIIGKMPHVLRDGPNEVVLNQGQSGWFAVVNRVYINTGMEKFYLQSDETPLEEMAAHELVHARLMAPYNGTVEWQEAQKKDGAFISDYAESNPVWEDIAESFVAYLALFHCDRVGADVCETIRNTMPHRIAFFDSLHLNMEPLVDFPFEINAGLSGAWYEPATSGQGFYLEVLPVSRLISLAWFTYDTERPPETANATIGDSGHRWMTALGPYEGNYAELTVYQTKGGVFDAETPKPVTDMAGDGTITIEFENCAKGTLHYDIASIGRSGSIPIQRIANDNVSLCETLSASSE